MAMGWYYKDSDGTIYWTYAGRKFFSNTDFAESLFSYIRKEVRASDTSILNSQRDIDNLKLRAKKVVYVDD